QHQRSVCARQRVSWETGAGEVWRGTVMPDLRETRRKVKIALAAMAAVDFVAIAVFFSPLVGSQAQRQEHLHDLWKELQQKTREVEPLRGLDKKVPVAKK